MNSNKVDIVFSLNSPKLCLPCRNRIKSKQVPKGLLKILDNELPRLQKELFFRITEWVQKHPIPAILITALFSVFLNLVSNFFYDLVKKWMR